MPRESYEPTDKDRKTVEAMAGYGIPQDEIALVLAICEPTLRKHFRRELDTGMVMANAKVAESLFKQATRDENPSTSAAIFWLKARAGWRETTNVNHSGSIDGGDLTDEQRVEKLGAVLDAARERLARDPSAGDS